MFYQLNYDTFLLGAAEQFHIICTYVQNIQTMSLSGQVGKNQLDQSRPKLEIVRMGNYYLEADMYDTRSPILYVHTYLMLGG